MSSGTKSQEIRYSILRIDGFRGSNRVQWDVLGRNQAAVTRGRDGEQ